MKSADVVQQLALKLPQYTDKFTNNVSITSLTQSAGTATATTSAAHGLAVGNQVNITGAKVPLSITSLTRVLTTGTLVVSSPHDLSEGFSTTVEITGATEAEFNGTFTILTIPDRYTVTFTMADAGATSATGTPLLLGATNYLNQYDGLHKVLTTPDTTSFTFAVTTTTWSPAYGTIEARTLPRVTAVVSEEVILNAYTQQAPDALWAFVVLGDVVANRSRQTETDAVQDTQRGQYFRTQLIQPMTVYVVIPTALENAARSARDVCEDLLQPITKSILFKRFNTYLTVSQRGPLQFVGHGFAAYTRGYYLHAYEFQQLADLTFGDTVGYDEDVAFRDISLSMTPDQGNQVEVLTASINLDGSGV